MGINSQLSTTRGLARFNARAGNPADPFYDNYGAFLPPEWYGLLSASGVNVTPELAMTLSAFHGGVKMICMDLATLPLQVFRQRDDGGKDHVRPYYGEGLDSSNGVRSLAYMLRWQPNNFQTATEFAMGMIAQFLLRGRAYAEIIGSPTSGFLAQLLPRHPDRITPERLPSGRLRYKLIEANGTPRWATQDEMFVVRDLSLDAGITTVGTVAYGANAIGTILAADQAAARFFKTGMIASFMAAYKGGQMEPDEEAALHASITRYAKGVENSFGLLLVPDNITIDKLGVEPEKAQMMLAREWGIYEVARYLRLPPSKLGAKDAVGYASAVQLAIDYVIGCLRPIATIFEQAIQRDLILAKDTYFTEFKLEALLRGDPAAQASYIESLVKARVLRPGTEARPILNMNPDPALDKLSEQDFRPGTSGAVQQTEKREARANLSDRAMLKGMLALHDNALRCVRRERHKVTQLAKKHGENVEGWQRELREFYAEHASFTAQTMRLPIRIARGYAAQHGTEFEARGIAIIDGEAGEQWQAFEADELCALVLDGERLAA